MSSTNTRIAALGATAALALSGCATTGVPEPTAIAAGSAIPASPAPAAKMGCDAAALQQSVIQRINEARQAGLCGDARLGAARPLVWQPALAATASKRAGEIAQRGSFGSVADVGPRLKQQGYIPTAAQETQAAGDYTDTGATMALLSQQKQCTTLLNPAYTDIGAACVTRPGSEFRHYWTVVVAKGTSTRSAMGASPAAKPTKKPGVKANSKVKKQQPKANALGSRHRGNDGKVR